MDIYPEVVRPGETYFDTFEFQGQEYYVNSIVTVKNPNWVGFRGSYLISLAEHKIQENGIEVWTYACWDYIQGVKHTTIRSRPDNIIQEILEPAEKPPAVPIQEFYKDAEVSQVWIGWVIYIAVMFFGMVFRGFGVLWVFATLYFFSWRSAMLAKPVKHDYGYNIISKRKELKKKRQEQELAEEDKIEREA